MESVVGIIIVFCVVVGVLAICRGVKRICKRYLKSSRKNNKHLGDKNYEMVK